MKSKLPDQLATAFFVESAMRNGIRATHLKIALTALLTTAAIVAPFSAVAQLGPPVLESDPRLVRRVSLNLAGDSLADVLRMVSTDKLRLHCDRECADMKVQIHVENRPIASLMRALGDLLPGDWQPTVGNSGYLLIMSPSAVHKRDRWWKLYLAERARALDNQRLAILTALRQGPERPIPGAPEPAERSDPRAQQERISHHEFFSSLPATLQSEIADNLNDAAFYHVGDVLFASSDDEGAVTTGVRSLPVGVAAEIEQKAKAIRFKYADSMDFDHATVLFMNGGFSLRAQVYFADGSTCGTAFGVGIPPVQGLFAALPDHARLAAVTDQLGKSAPPAWKELTAIHRSRVWPNELPAEPKLARSQYSRQADLDWMARKGGVEFVADYHSHGGSPMLPADANQPISGPVDAQMNLQAVQHDQSWKKTADGIYLVRNNRWYRDDRLEAPAPLLIRWMAQRESEKDAAESREPVGNVMDKSRLRKQLDWEAEAATSLTRWQIENGLMLYQPDDTSESQRKKFAESGRPLLAGPHAGQMGYNSIVLLPFAEDAARLHSQYRTALFYAGLSSTQRQSAIEGTLRLSDLTADQQRQASFLTRGVAAIEAAGGQPVLLGIVPKTGPGVMHRSVRLAVMAP